MTPVQKVIATEKRRASAQRLVKSLRLLRFLGRLVEEPVYHENRHQRIPCENPP
jgi:hypothetical protein